MTWELAWQDDIGSMLWKRLAWKIDGPRAQAVHFIVEVDGLADGQSDIVCERDGLVLALLITNVVFIYHDLAVRVLNSLVLTDHLTTLMIWI